MSNLELGQQAEQIARNYLIAQNYVILEKNYYNQKGYRIGEVDLVARNKDGRYTFVEVKARRGKPGVVIPEENITPSKIRKIEKAANHYLFQRGEIDADWRIESIGIILDFETRKIDIKHLKNIRL